MLGRERKAEATPEVLDVAATVLKAAGDFARLQAALVPISRARTKIQHDFSDLIQRDIENELERQKVTHEIIDVMAALTTALTGKG